MTTRTAIQKTFDLGSVFLGVLCLLHCLASPLLFAMLPFLGFADSSHQFHQVLVIITCVFSFVAISFGYIRHKRASLVLAVMVGLAALFFAAFFGHDILGESGERMVTMSAVILLSLAHIANFMLTNSRRQKIAD